MVIQRKDAGQAPTFSDASLRFEITEQRGALIAGRELSQDVEAAADPWPVEEAIIGVITADGERLDIVDANGRNECTIVSADQLDCVYWHITPKASLIARSTWKRDVR